LGSDQAVLFVCNTQGRITGIGMMQGKDDNQHAFWAALFTSLFGLSDVVDHVLGMMIAGTR